MLRIFKLVCAVLFIPFTAFSQVFACNDGTVKFTSEAKMEVIKAESHKLSGAVDASSRNFAFSVAIESFEGFNSGLQREHFNENYMESSKYRTGEFKGRIQESIDLNKDGTYTVKAKGTLDIHGVKKERVITAKVTVRNKVLRIESDFDVELSDHKIKIPKVMNQKIATLIKVNVNAELKERKKVGTD